MIHINFNEEKSVATVSLARIDKSNAMNVAFIQQLTRHIEELKQMPTLKVCIIQSEAKHFCVGADIAWMKSSLSLSAEENKQDVTLLAELFKKLYQLPMVTITVVNGAAFGGGLGLLACCDFIIATEQAKFCFSEIKLGILPATIAPYVSHKIAWQVMKRLMLTAELFNAEEAKQYGFVDEVIQSNDLDSCLEQWRNKFLLYSKQALVEGKKMFAQMAPIHEDLYHSSINRLATMRQSVDGQEGLTAFLEKREPKWSDDV